ncbi:MAG TPA: HAMP domain-containing sensor histidine kinase [Thermoanaerobaculia bacterium]|nr:HAMP domain-containing sensor histidine kinase [Thermoanaerobaculia bacterium]
MLAPTGDDAALIAGILQERALEALIVPDLATLAREIATGAGVALIASEALDGGESVTALRKVLDAQQAWSELPILLFGGGIENAASVATELLGSRAQLVLLERPLGIAAFVTATDAALRSRCRQYEVKRLLDQLAESAVEIARVHEAATRAKDDFLATLGHELRSPMTAIRGWIEMLKMDDLSEEDRTMALTMIESSTKVQAHIVEDLMDVSKIIAGKVMIAPEEMTLAPLVQNIAATFRAAAAEQDITLTVDIPAEPLRALVDEIRLQQVGWNLISNAIKFTPKGGSVHVSLTREENHAAIRVRDTGEGMSAEFLPHVFERYRQAEGGTKRPHAGLGLGLAIVRHLVESHGGAIDAFSDGAGKGAEFVVWLPLLDDDARPA